MRVGILSVVLCFVASVIYNANAQFAQPSPRLSIDRSSAITGVLRDTDAIGIGGVRIELRDLASNALVAFATSHNNGSFELYNIPAGNYEIVAKSDGIETRQQVEANGIANTVELRLACPSGSTHGASISVVRLKVPQKARDRYNNAAEAYAQGKLDQAQKAVDKSLAICPANPEALTLHGLLAWRKQNIDAAIQDFQKSIDIDPSYQLAYTAMGSILNSQGKFDDAARTTERAVALDPTAWQSYFEMAKALLGKGLYQKALQVAGTAQTLGPNGFAAIHLLKAYAMVPLKLYKDAAVELQAFLSHAQQGPDISSVKQLLAKVEAAEAATPSAGAPVPGMALISH